MVVILNTHAQKNNTVMILNTHAQKEQHHYDAEHASADRTTKL